MTDPADHQARTREIEVRLEDRIETEERLGRRIHGSLDQQEADFRYLLDRVRALEAALEPFAGRAREFDERVYPPEHDGAGVSVRLGELRAAARLLPAPETVETA